ncbi:uncharacterized protein BDV17DRAFT_272813 [Aspergillus undulatus]|uniref:uncharacterized protein n=1 Tax=Aspergillus undulatus TaxID=1810928 RepID=UPI003CCE11FC
MLVAAVAILPICQILSASPPTRSLKTGTWTTETNTWISTRAPVTRINGRLSRVMGSRRLVGLSARRDGTGRCSGVDIVSKSGEKRRGLQM